MSVTPAPIEVFCSYSHKDEVWLRKLETHLSLLKKQGLISLWHDRLISAGTDWAQNIDTKLETASIVLLLISADFVASDYCFSIEMSRALARQEAGEARVIPILLRKANLHGAPFAHLQALPSNGQPLATWKDKDSGLADVAEGLRRVITEEMRAPATHTSRAGLSTVWNIPYSHNPFFTGRTDELEALRTQVQSHSNVGQTGHIQAISGLGGIGKTRLAVEYAHHYRNKYKVVLWANADTRESLNASYSEIAHLLNLPEKDATEQAQATIMKAVKDWLGTQRDYLLILDNADEPELLVPFIPQSVGGHLLITTRSTAVRRLNIASFIMLETLTPEQGALFLLHRAGLLAHDAPLAQASSAYQLQAQNISKELGGLPLALEQAAAYIDEAADLVSYLQIYKERRAQLLKENRPLTYPNSVATTWELSFHNIEQKNPAAADLLRFCAFLAPDAIPEAIVSRGAEALGPHLSPVAGDADLLNRAIVALRAYSLIARDPHGHTLSVHRLVQAVLRDSIDAAQRSTWAERAIRAMNKAIPEHPAMPWQEWQPYLPHVDACTQLINEYKLVSAEAGKLLIQAGAMLRYYSRPSEAEKMYEQAMSIYERVLGPEHPETAATLDTLATIIGSQRRYAEALQLFERALSIRERVLGPEHPATAATINGIALLYSHWHQFEESQRMYKRALSIRERVLGPEHPDTVTTLANLATLYRFWEKYDQAQDFFERAVHIYERSLGPEDPTSTATLNDLAGIYRIQHKYEQAIPLFKRVVHAQEQTLGLEHPETARTISNLAYLYAEQGAYEQSMHMYERALHIREQLFGIDHPNATITHLNMGQLYQKQGNYQRAEELYQHALKTHEQALGTEHVRVAIILEVYAGLLHELRRDDEMKQVEARAQAIRRKIAAMGGGRGKATS